MNEKQNLNHFWDKTRNKKLISCINRLISFWAKSGKKNKFSQTPPIRTGDWLIRFCGELFSISCFYGYRKLRFSSFFIKSRSFWFFRNWCILAAKPVQPVFGVCDTISWTRVALMLYVARWWDFNVKIVGCRTCFCVQTLRLFDKLPNENKISKDSKKKSCYLFCWKKLNILTKT
jgi:hypothetical protein